MGRCQSKGLGGPPSRPLPPTVVGFGALGRLPPSNSSDMDKKAWEYAESGSRPHDGVKDPGKGYSPRVPTKSPATKGVTFDTQSPYHQGRLLTLTTGYGQIVKEFT